MIKSLLCMVPIALVGLVATEAPAATAARSGSIGRNITATAPEGTGVPLALVCQRGGRGGGGYRGGGGSSWAGAGTATGGGGGAAGAAASGGCTQAHSEPDSTPDNSTKAVFPFIALLRWQGNSVSAGITVAAASEAVSTVRI